MCIRDSVVQGALREFRNKDTEDDEDRSDERGHQTGDGEGPHRELKVCNERRKRSTGDTYRVATYSNRDGFFYALRNTSGFPKIINIFLLYLFFTVHFIRVNSKQLTKS